MSSSFMEYLVALYLRIPVMFQDHVLVPVLAVLHLILLKITCPSLCHLLVFVFVLVLVFVFVLPCLKIMQLSYYLYLNFYLQLYQPSLMGMFLYLYSYIIVPALSTDHLLALVLFLVPLLYITCPSSYLYLYLREPTPSHGNALTFPSS